MIVLGIDPGSRKTGWGVVQRDGSRMRLVAAGVLCPKGNAPLADRLAFLHAGVTRLVDEHAPAAVGMESVFHGPNTRSLVILGQARGAILAALGEAEPVVTDLSPAEVKKALTGRGAATKEQVGHMVRVMLDGTLSAEQASRLGLDATDALAVAIATAHVVSVKAAMQGGR